MNDSALSHLESIPMSQLPENQNPLLIVPPAESPHKLNITSFYILVEQDSRQIRLMEVFKDTIPGFYIGLDAGGNIWRFHKNQLHYD